MSAGTRRNGWLIIGPGGGGAQYIPTVRPGDPNTALVACDMTCSFVTRDGGKTWKQFNLKGWVRAFAFDPTNPDRVYAGATGLYRSEDAGETWRLVFPDPDAVICERTSGDEAEHAYVSTDNWPGGRVEAICVDPDDPARIYIGVAGGAPAVWFSANGGKSWVECCRVPGSRFRRSYLDRTSPCDDRLLFVLTDAGLYRVAPARGAIECVALPEGAEVLDLGYGVDRATGAPILYLAGPVRWEHGAFRGGVYRSSDRGQTWEAASEGLDADLLAGQDRRFTVAAACPGDAAVAYVAVAEPIAGSEPQGPGVHYFGILKSEDAGMSWRWVLRIGRTNAPNRSPGWVERDYAPDWGGGPFGLGVSPENPQVCYATDWGTSYRTVDGGATWEQLYCDVHGDGSVSTRGLDVLNTYALAFDPFDEKHMALACTDVGAFHSLNAGASWQHAIAGVPESWSNTCYRIVFDPEVRGRAWSVWSGCHDMPRAKMFRSGRLDRYEGGVCRSDDGLVSWRPTSTGMPDHCIPTDIAIDPRSPAAQRLLYVAAVGQGVFRSTDGGRTWEPRNQGITDSLNAWRIVLLPDGSLYLLVCRGLEDGRAVAGGLYHSTDGASNWRPLPLPPGVTFPNDLAFDPSQPQRLYLACWPLALEGTRRGGGLYRSGDGGRTWVRVFDDAAHVYGVAVDPRRPATVYLASFEGAVYRSDDMGDSWARLAGYDFKWAKSPIRDPYRCGMLYVTTFGSSVWYGPA